MLCQDTEKIHVYNIREGKVTSSIGEYKDSDLEHDDRIYAFALNPDDLSIVTSHKSGLLKLWNKHDGTLVKMWKGVHNGPIQKLTFNGNGNLIASGGSDSMVRVWKYEHKVCLAGLKGCSGVISVVEFHPDLNKSVIVAAADNNVINGWDYDKRELLFSLPGHFSKVTSLNFTQDGNYLLSTSRDKVIILWSLETLKQLKTIPVYETIESGVLIKSGTKLPNGYVCKDNNIYIATGGEKGLINIWEMLNGKLIYTQTNTVVSLPTEESIGGITQILINKTTKSIALVTFDHNIIIHKLKTFDCVNQIVGYFDEILDICFAGKNDRFLAVATNSNHIKLYDTTTMNCKILKGHTDIVLSVEATKNFLLSSSKDNSIRLWQLDFENFTAVCVGVGAKHASSVGSIAFGRISHRFCVSVSQDTCLKLWSIPKVLDKDNITQLKCKATQIVHEKDVNSVAVSPNDKLIATGSQDKTAKLWDCENLSLVGVFRGHKRGVWSVRFSPIDQILLTTSADASVKLWSLSDMSCVKTFEGHEGSVLRGEFLSNGTQIISTSADGIIKVWSIKTSDCCTTLEHDCKIWAAAVASSGTHFYTGGSDSQLIRWRDVTEETKIKAFESQQQIVLEEQELNNLLKEKKLLKALKYALRLERPHLTLKIIEDVIKIQDVAGLEETIVKLDNSILKESLLKHAINWNTNSRYSRSAQLVINILLKQIISKQFQPAGVYKIVEETLPYTERHFKRLTEYMKDLKYLEYTMKCMQSTFETNKIV